MSRSTPRVERGGDERVPQRVQRFPVTGIEVPRVPPEPSPGRGRRRPGRRPARSDEISRFAVAGGTRDSVQYGGGRGTLRSARSALSVSGPAQASAANRSCGFARLPTCGCHHALRPSAGGGCADSGQPALARRSVRPAISGWWRTKGRWTSSMIMSQARTRSGRCGCWSGRMRLWIGSVPFGSKAGSSGWPLSRGLTGRRSPGRATLS